MSRTNFDQLLQAGCHFGHLRRKWNPAMAPYIFMERNGIHIIDLNKTVAKIDEAAEALKELAKTGRKILFVATKKQAKDVVAEKAASINMPYVNERWAGGMLTNFPTIRKAVKKMTNIDRMLNDGTFSNLSKRELLQISRQRAKLEKNLGSIADLARLPIALFVVDVMKEHIAVKEANRLGIPVFGIVDTNSDPKNVDYVIPANDDAKDSVDAILTAVCGAIAEALEERKAEKAASINMPYVNERWAGGMLTNFPTIRKAVKKMTNIDRLLNDGTFSNLSKRELLQVSRQRAKLEKNLGSIADMARLPVALFVVDVMKEHIAVKEANRLGIPVFGIVDTNSDPKNVDYVIPANDDAKDSVDAILTAVCGAIAEALEERKAEKADDKAAAEQKDQPKKKAARKDEAE